jgi:hypothetical protein
MVAQSSGEISENSGKCRTNSALCWKTLRTSQWNVRAGLTFPFAFTCFSLFRWSGWWRVNLVIAHRVTWSVQSDHCQIPKKAYRRANSPSSIGKFQWPENLLRRFFPTSCGVADEVDSQVQPNAIKLTMKPPCTLKRQYSAANRDS